MSAGLAKAIEKAWGMTAAEQSALLDHADRDERLRVIYMIHATLADLFVDPDDEGRWLRRALPYLGHKSPLDTMLQQGIRGIAAVEVVVAAMANR